MARGLGGDGYGYAGFPEYVSVAARRAAAKRAALKLTQRGAKLAPIIIEGSKIAKSYWGKAWCAHLERHSDYANRLPRGRSYVRNGAVIDLRVSEGRVDALVRGSSLYTVAVEIERLAPKKWAALTKRCAGRIESVVELLQGQVPEAVLSVLGDAKAGLFPAPTEIKLHCSCPDSAYLCKHLAAVLYGVGARLDAEPELFFTLRRVALAELVAQSTVTAKPRAGKGKRGTIAATALEGIFGIELDVPEAEPRPSGARERVTKGKAAPGRGTARQTAARTARRRRPRG